MQPLSIDEAVLAIKRHQRFAGRQQSPTTADSAIGKCCATRYRFSWKRRQLNREACKPSPGGCIITNVEVIINPGTFFRKFASIEPAFGITAENSVWEHS